VVPPAWPENPDYDNDNRSAGAELITNIYPVSSLTSEHWHLTSPLRRAAAQAH
jgi:hypothetical protein